MDRAPGLGGSETLDRAGDPGSPSPQLTPRPRREPDENDFQIQDLAAFMARGLVDHPDRVRVEMLAPGPDTALELHVHPDDLGHVIGKQGRTARALRLALSAAAGRADRNVDLEIAD